MSARIHKSDPTWTPPHGWQLVAPNVWHPTAYRPTRWELSSPRIHNEIEARADLSKCLNADNGLAYFAFHHAWTVDVDDPVGSSPRKVPAFPYLNRFFRSVQKPENCHVEKSRQMLMSWAWMVVFVYDVLFHTNWQALVLSKRAKDVDDGPPTINSNFGKIIFILDHLPPHLWLPYVHKAYQIRIPRTNSTIVGETGKGGMASRGPTFNRALMDEAAYIQHSETVFAGLRQAAKRGTILNSTPNGKGNTFARIRFSNTTSFRKLSFHWSEHPRKAAGLYCVCGWKARLRQGHTNVEQFMAHAPECPRLLENPPKRPQMRSPWYDGQAADLTPDKVASELDISYEGSRAGRVYGMFDQTRHVVQMLDRIGPRYIDEDPDEYRQRYLRLALDPNLETFTTMDIGIGDPTSMLLGQIVDPELPIVRFLDEVEESEQSYDFFVRVIDTVWRPALAAIGASTDLRHFGGQDMNNRDSRKDSWFTNMAREGVYVEYNPDGRAVGGLLEWVDYINDLYRRGLIEISDWCTHLVDATENYHYPTGEDGLPLPGRHLPVHDEWSHSMSAKRYLYEVRFRQKLKDRLGAGVPTRRILARSSGFDRKSEGRIF